MHASGATPVLDRIPDGCGHDASLENTVRQARQEFSELSDEQLKDLWIRLQSILIGWAAREGESLPRHRTFYRGAGRYLDPLQTGTATQDEIDFVVLFFLAEGCQALDDFLQGLAPQPLMSLRKALALLILKQAQDKNCSEVRRLAHSFERVLQ